MDPQDNPVIWGAIGVVIIGILAIVVISVQSASEPEPFPTRVGDEPTSEANINLLTPVAATATPAGPQQEVPAEDATVATPAPTPTLPPLVLPDATPPADGEMYVITPSSQDVGWVRAGDSSANHFGDYNIYAGIYDGQEYIGAMRFDLSTIPPGAPILHADLTLTGLSDEWLGGDGAWTVELLQPWLDTDWSQQDFHWFGRADSGAGPLAPELRASELAVGKSNTFFFSPQALQALETRVFGGYASFRAMGPDEGEEMLFSWDSGHGSGSLGRGPLLRIITGPAPEAPPPSPTPAYILITSTPTPASIVAVAAEKMTATAQAPPYEGEGTPTPTATATPLPPNWVTPVVIVPTATPENQATAQWHIMVATAEAFVYGTPTATPPNVWTATPAPTDTPIPLVIPFETLTPTPTPTITPTALPNEVKGRIAFMSDRLGGSTVMIMDPDGSNASVMTNPWVYHEARRRDSFSPDGQYRVVVQNDHRRVPQLFIISLVDGSRRQLTQLGKLAYDPAWSPVDNRIAFVSPDPGSDEIFTVWSDGSGMERLTHHDWEWDKHPSWSPDGSQMVFWSNRETGRQQIWIMDRDGSNPRNISNNEYNDWNPVWIK